MVPVALLQPSAPLCLTLHIGPHNISYAWHSATPSGFYLYKILIQIKLLSMKFQSI